MIILVLRYANEFSTQLQVNCPSPNTIYLVTRSLRPSVHNRSHDAKYVG